MGKASELVLGPPFIVLSKSMAQGFVYILVSPNSSYIKIGGTTHPIAKRLKEINGTVPYADHGPWQLSDFLHVTDWQRVEGGLHRYFQERQVRDAGGASELFSVPPHEARTQMRSVGDMLRVDRDTTLRVFKDRDLALYLYRLFNLSGLFGALDIQGAWTLRLLTRTSGGTWFTLNIGSHAVAFSMRNKQKEPPTHYLSVDRLIRDYAETVRWIRKHDGGIEHSPYHKPKHAVQIDFDAGFADAEKVFNLPGIRRSLVAYWSDALADLRERSAKSSYARYHSYDAVAELLHYKYDYENVFAAIKPKAIRRA
jgi:hypothetical protein